MRLLMLSGDRQVSIGEQGPFHAMQREFSRWFERIDVLCPKPPKPPTVSTIWERVHFHPSPSSRAGMLSYLTRRGGELLALHRHELIVSHDYGWFYNGLAAARLSRAHGVPYLSEIHHVPGFPVAADFKERIDRVIAELYVRWASERALAFRVVNSAEMPPLLERWGVPRDKVIVLPSLYIDLAVFSPTNEPVEPELDVLFVGRMVNNKGLDRIVDALAELDRRGTKTRSLFVGKGPLRAATIARAERRGLDARFVEWVQGASDLAELYRKSRVVVCASTCEGGPRFTVEAMACGTPVVSTAVGMMTELLQDGAAGRLVGFDVESLTEGLAAVLADERRRRELGLEARRRAERFEYSQILRGYAEGLHRLVGLEGVRR
ncbi:MAG: glycosyltransferase family 4 protein [Planctomycetes bacterium]|nr:glycosyltransferase family 4 protein [Planctomycetota bacterium]